MEEGKRGVKKRNEIKRRMERMEVQQRRRRKEKERRE